MYIIYKVRFCFSGEHAQNTTYVFSLHEFIATLFFHSCKWFLQILKKKLGIWNISSKFKFISWVIKERILWFVLQKKLVNKFYFETMIYYLMLNSKLFSCYIVLLSIAIRLLLAFVGVYVGTVFLQNYGKTSCKIKWSASDFCLLLKVENLSIQSL